MRKLTDISEDEMVAIFLKAELASPRFRKFVLRELRKCGQRTELIRSPNLLSVTENRLRRKILSGYRGFGANKALFKGFPADVSWARVQMSQDDLKRLRYISNEECWQVISGPKRFCWEGAAYIRTHRSVPFQDRTKYVALARALSGGVTVPEVILVADPLRKKIVILEGHLRATAMNMVPESLETNPTALLGTSRSVRDWLYY